MIPVLLVFAVIAAFTGWGIGELLYDELRERRVSFFKTLFRTAKKVEERVENSIKNFDADVQRALDELNNEFPADLDDAPRSPDKEGTTDSARQIINKLLPIIQKRAKQVDVCGSAPYLDDQKLVCFMVDMPKEDAVILSEKLTDDDESVDTSGDVCKFKIGHIEVRLLIVPEKYWGQAKVLYSGNTAWTRLVIRRAVRRGFSSYSSYGPELHIEGYGGRASNKELANRVDNKSEKEVLEFLGLEQYIDPATRFIK
jgi:hypothetical protein